jgi:membrane protein
MVLAMGVPFLLSTIATSITASLGSLAEFNLFDGSPWGEFAGLILLAVDWGMIFLVFLVAYRFVPNTKTHWRYVWLGAVVAAVLFLSGRYIFIWYLGNWARYDTVYGPVSSIMVFLFWTYLSALILVLGAEISSEFERMKRLGGADSLLV